ncbi:hypothetical protein EYF80_059224 [Liparis tanakae]|uniref:Uncharacterized protein n=1 Tax=Liparis tanakae TaxID=230148 RepID=A0A4Z2EQH7_9TELE|nr:hypothetical protein EYF80_059224 [Liparis tanakae]
MKEYSMLHARASPWMLNGLSMTKFPFQTTDRLTGSGTGGAKENQVSVRRQPGPHTSHLISSHLISSHLISSHLISSHLISSHRHHWNTRPVDRQLLRPGRGRVDLLTSGPPVSLSSDPRPTGSRTLLLQGR